MEIKTPAYCFDENAFAGRVRSVKEVLSGIPLCYALKANAFLLHCLPEEIERIEVCSPGELTICERLGIPGEKIIYSGVVKGPEDTAEAIAYGAGLITAESPRQFELVRDCAAKAGTMVRVLLRLTSGNQFGMNAEEIREIISEAAETQEKDSVKTAELPETDTARLADAAGIDRTVDKKSTGYVRIAGIHFYSGTAKKKVKQIEKDLAKLEGLLIDLAEKEGFRPEIVEYGPGLAAACFGAPEEELEETDNALLLETTPLLTAFEAKWPLSLEFGRFLTAPAGRFHTTVRDIKRNEDVTYVLLNGGIHQLKYYGQTMSMQVPPITVVPAPAAAEGKTAAAAASPLLSYCLCGSLCTVADVLVREVQLPEIHVGDELVFARCGAYSVTEASALFLSRSLPRVYLAAKDGCLTELRGAGSTADLNA